MAQGTCSKCNQDVWVKARGMCKRCYDHERHGGRITDPHHAVDVEAWISGVTGTAGCWLWPGLLSDGYGRPAINGRSEFLHRYLWARTVGPIPEGMQLDHLCHTTALDRGECAGGPTCEHRRCANPAHMEVVPLRVNVERGNGLAAINAAKTWCDSGHEFTLANTIIRNSGRRAGNRECRECQRSRNRAYRARLRHHLTDSA